jgi:hypothetical protein
LSEERNMPATFDLVFPWTVATGGYTWIDAGVPNTKSRGAFLTPGVPVGGRFEQLRYLPLAKYSGLFRDFAFVDTDRAALKTFADRTGLLGGSMTQEIKLEQADGRQLMGVGESLKDWRTAVLSIRRCVELHDAVLAGDIDTLKRHIVWQGGRVSYMSHPHQTSAEKLVRERAKFSLIADRLSGNASVEGLVVGDVVQPAQLFIQKEVNRQLEKQTRTQLLWNRERTRLTNFVVPESLLGAMWLQFSLAIERGSRFRRCQECGTWFELAPQTARSDKLFCSAACRLKAFRKRQEKSGVDEASAPRSKRSAATKQKPSLQNPPKAASARRKR